MDYEFLMRFRCQRHAGCVVRIAEDTTYFEDAGHDNGDRVLNAENMYCEGRESGPDPVEDPDCSESWTVSMLKIKQYDEPIEFEEGV